MLVLYSKTGLVTVTNNRNDWAGLILVIITLHVTAALQQPARIGLLLLTEFIMLNKSVNARKQDSQFTFMPAELLSAAARQAHINAIFSRWKWIFTKRPSGLESFQNAVFAFMHAEGKQRLRLPQQVTSGLIIFWHLGELLATAHVAKAVLLLNLLTKRLTLLHINAYINSPSVPQVWSVLYFKFICAVCWHKFLLTRFYYNANTVLSRGQMK